MPPRKSVQTATTESNDASPDSPTMEQPTTIQSNNQSTLPPIKINIADHSAVRNTLDEAIVRFINQPASSSASQSTYEEDHTVSNYKLILGFIAVFIALLANLNLPFNQAISKKISRSIDLSMLESKPFLIASVVIYFAISGLVQCLHWMNDKDCVCVTKPKVSIILSSNNLPYQCHREQISRRRRYHQLLQRAISWSLKPYLNNRYFKQSKTYNYLTLRSHQYVFMFLFCLYVVLLICVRSIFYLIWSFMLLAVEKCDWSNHWSWSFSVCCHQEIRHRLSCHHQRTKVIHQLIQQSTNWNYSNIQDYRLFRHQWFVSRWSIQSLIRSADERLPEETINAALQQKPITQMKYLK